MKLSYNGTEEYMTHSLFIVLYNRVSTRWYVPTGLLSSDSFYRDDHLELATNQK